MNVKSAVAFLNQAGVTVIETWETPTSSRYWTIGEVDYSDNELTAVAFANGWKDDGLSDEDLIDILETGNAAQLVQHHHAWSGSAARVAARRLRELTQ